MNERRKINVLQLVEGFSLGGAEGKLLELVKCLDPNRFRIVVCGLGLEGPSGTIREEFEKLKDYGIEVIKIPRKYRIDFSLIYKLVNLIRNYRIDIIMTTLFYADVVGSIIGKLGKVKATNGRTALFLG